MQIPKICSVCKSEALSWSVDVIQKPSSSAPYNRQNQSDFYSALMLGCDECSETLLLLDASSEEGLLIIKLGAEAHRGLYS